MTATVGIIDFGLCNLDSIKRAVERCGARAIVTSTAGDLDACDRLIIPGVGAFATAIGNLREDGMDRAILERRSRENVPILGICLGMHLLAESSTEGGNSTGLGLLPGCVERLVATSDGERVPHVGWNDIEIHQPHALFDGVASGTDFYFVHGYKFVPGDAGDTLASSTYCGGFSAAASAPGHVYGVQFHPEKSMAAGLTLLGNFVRLKG
jgi:imidazole glycerol-phosphate synthase subunit HisH